MTTKLTDEQLLAELEQILRAAPPMATFSHPTPENFAWRGRASSFVALWDRVRSPFFNGEFRQLDSYDGSAIGRAHSTIMTTLYEAQHSLMMRTGGPRNIQVETGKVFEYFDEVRKVIELARKDLFFVDRYLDADFVSRYLPLVPTGISVRLLTSGKDGQKALPAIEMLCAQNAIQVALRTSPEPHERWLFVDGRECFLSGASFKDGGRLSPATLTQLSESFTAVSKTYEEIWARATVLR